MMNQTLFSNINVPKNWSGKQAKAVIDFIEDIAQTIWDVHEIAILKEHENRNLKIVLNEHNDDFPF